MIKLSSVYVFVMSETQEELKDASGILQIQMDLTGNHKSKSPL